jgi:hypothetical protein
LGHIADNDDATCGILNRGVYQYVDVKKHRMSLSQCREMFQFHKKEATCVTLTQVASERLAPQT